MLGTTSQVRGASLSQMGRRFSRKFQQEDHGLAMDQALDHPELWCPRVVLSKPQAQLRIQCQCPALTSLDDSCISLCLSLTIESSRFLGFFTFLPPDSLPLWSFPTCERCSSICFHSGHSLCSPQGAGPPSKPAFPSYPLMSQEAISGKRPAV